MSQLSSQVEKQLGLSCYLISSMASQQSFKIRSMKDNIIRDHKLIMIEQSETKKIANKYVVYLKEVLGRGTFATTHLCRLRTNPSHVLACKVMNKSEILKLVPNLEYLIERVREEAKAWKELDHPNIVKFQDCKETSNNIYFFLEYCSEGSLESYISKNRFSRNIPEIVSFSKQLISACTLMESKNILHRDIKPANILIHQGQVKLGDFGLARVIDHTDEESLKSYFTFAGTLQFMAPQILRSEKYSFKCDVWSVGVTIFMIFTNQLPFGLTPKDNSEVMILQKIEKHIEEFDYPAFKGQGPIVQLLKKMLNPDPHSRPKMAQIEADSIKL